MTRTPDYLAGWRDAQNASSAAVEGALMEVTDNLMANLTEPGEPMPAENVRLGQAVAWLTYAAATIRALTPPEETT